MKILSLNRKFIAKRVNQLKICNKFQISSKTKYHLEKKKNILVRLSGDPVSMASVHLSAYETRRFGLLHFGLRRFAAIYMETFATKLAARRRVSLHAPCRLHAEISRLCRRENCPPVLTTEISRLDSTRPGGRCARE